MKIVVGGYYLFNDRVYQILTITHRKLSYLDKVFYNLYDMKGKLINKSYDHYMHLKVHNWKRVKPKGRQPGWLGKQLEKTSKEVESWPEWMKPSDDSI